MKKNTLALFASLALGGSAFSIEPGRWGTVSTLTVALTATSETPGTVLKDESGRIVLISDGGGPVSENTYSVSTLDRDGNETKRIDTHEIATKTMTYKFGNAEILRQLIIEGSLPAIGSSQPTIMGWSIVIVSDETKVKTLYARHTSKVMVELSGIDLDTFNGVSPEAQARTINYKEVITTATNPLTGESTTSRLLTDTLTSKAFGKGSFTVGSDTFSVAGLYTETASKTVIKLETIAGEKVYTDIWVAGALKLDKITGARLSDSFPNGEVIEGTLSTTASVVTDLNLYFPAM
jgi:hypothetical protein